MAFETFVTLQKLDYLKTELFLVSYFSQTALDNVRINIYTGCPNFSTLAVFNVIVRDTVWDFNIAVLLFNKNLDSVIKIIILYDFSLHDDFENNCIFVAY